MSFQVELPVGSFFIMHGKEGGSIRERRKLDHLHLALDLPDGPVTTGFEDIYLVHDSLPELDFDDVDLATTFLGKPLKVPLLINAMTGGIAQAEDINRSLSLLAANNGIGVAVGSQIIGVEDGVCPESFCVVRRVNPDGLVLANVSALTRPKTAVQAVEMIEADALQVHLNIPQELAMPEGDRRFKGMLDNIADVVHSSPVPVIAKEVGFGLSRETAARLLDTGVEYLDIGGQGGTNFVAIENRRGGLFDEDMLSWGIPTAISLVEVLSLPGKVRVIASGGIRSSLQAAKALALGADMVGIAGSLLKVLYTGGPDALQSELDRFCYRLKAITLMVGARTLPELRLKPVVITGKTAEWLRARGIDISGLAK